MKLYDFFLILTYLSVTSGHKISSYGSSLYSTIGGLFFLLSIFYGLVQYFGGFLYIKNILLINYNHYLLE